MKEFICNEIKYVVNIVSSNSCCTT